MVNEQQQQGPVVPGPVGRRRRQPNVAGGRTGSRVDVKLSAEETALLRAKADELGVSVPRLLVESALTAVETSTERRNALTELFALQRVLSGIANNINQLAKHANTDGRFPDRAFDELVARVFDVIFKINPVLDQFALTAPARRRRPRRAAQPIDDDQDDDDVDTTEWEDADH